MLASEKFSTTPFHPCQTVRKLKNNKKEIKRFSAIPFPAAHTLMVRELTPGRSCRLLWLVLLLRRTCVRNHRRLSSCPGAGRGTAWPIFTWAASHCRGITAADETFSLAPDSGDQQFSCVTYHRWVQSRHLQFTSGVFFLKFCCTHQGPASNQSDAGKLN